MLDRHFWMTNISLWRAADPSISSTAGVERPLLVMPAFHAAAIVALGDCSASGLPPPNEHHGSGRLGRADIGSSSK